MLQRQRIRQQHQSYGDPVRRFGDYVVDLEVVPPPVDGEALPELAYYSGMQ